MTREQRIELIALVGLVKKFARMAQQEKGGSAIFSGDFWDELYKVEEQLRGGII